MNTNQPRREPCIEDILSFSVGIGRNLNSADFALRIAQEDGDKSSLRNIVVLDESVSDLEYTPVFKVEDYSKEVEDYNKVLRCLIASNAPSDVIEAHERSVIDRKTGLLNPVGYSIAMAAQDRKGKDIGYYVFLDGNNMKAHNEKSDRSYVDELLAAAGQGIRESTRSGLGTGGRNWENPDRRESFLSNDIISYRKNYSGGDEFIIYIPLQHSPENLETVIGIAGRVLEHIYAREMEQAKKYIQALDGNTSVA